MLGVGDGERIIAPSTDPAGGSTKKVGQAVRTSGCYDRRQSCEDSVEICSTADDHSVSHERSVGHVDNAQHRCCRDPELSTDQF